MDQKGLVRLMSVATTIYITHVIISAVPSTTAEHLRTNAAVPGYSVVHLHGEASCALLNTGGQRPSHRRKIHNQLTVTVRRCKMMNRVDCAVASRNVAADQTFVTGSKRKTLTAYGWRNKLEQPLRTLGGRRLSEAPRSVGGSETLGRGDGNVLRGPVPVHLFDALLAAGGTLESANDRVALTRFSYQSRNER